MVTTACARLAIATVAYSSRFVIPVAKNVSGETHSASTVIVCGIAALVRISAILSYKFAGDLPRLSFLFFIVRCCF